MRAPTRTRPPARALARVPPRRLWGLRIVVAAVVLALGVPAAVAAPPAGAGQRDGREGPGWARCGRALECATVTDTVEYRDPGGPEDDVAVVRVPARDPDRRIGSLVVNFGGPGDAGTETLPLALDRFPARIRDRFDLVSFDPRGVGGTNPIDCVDDATADRLAAEDPTPDDLAELQRFYTGDHTAVDLDAACVERHGAWLAAIGSRNVARDLDRIRAALGDDRLNYLGYSYGTVLGALYAQEFPDRVRTMVLDGPVNLSATPAEELDAVAAGFERALDELLTWCAQEPRCRYGDGDPRAALLRLRDRFEAGATLPVADGRRAGVGTFYLALVASLYDRGNGWPALVLALASAERGDGTVLQLLADAYLGRDRDGRYSSLHEAIQPIRCVDERRPLVEFAEYRAVFEQLRATYPVFGALVGSTQTGCDPRLPAAAPGEEVGDLRAAPRARVLLIGTTGDPATPYAGALDLQQRIAGSRLLTFESTEHGAFGRGVACVDDAVDRYLVRKRLPPPGTRCLAAD